MTVQRPTNDTAIDKIGIDPPQQILAPLMELSRRGEFGRLADETVALLSKFPGSPMVLSLAVSANGRLGRTTQAEEFARRAVSLYPDTAAGFHNLGMALRAQGKIEEAIAAFDRAVELDERLVPAQFYRGLMHYRKGDLDNASLSFEGVLRIDPDFAAAHYYRAGVLSAKGEHRAAVAAYADAIRLRPDFPEAYNDQGTVLLKLMELDAAMVAFQNAIRLKPELAMAHENLGMILSTKKDLVDALKAFDRAFSLDPRLQSALAQKLFTQAQICDFTAAGDTLVEKVGNEVTPFSMLSLEDRPERHLARSAHHWKRRTRTITPLPLPARPRSRPSRLRVGYFSSDFHEHATLRLMSGLIREHDRSRFEIFVYSYGLGKSGPLRERLQQDDLNFHDVQPFTDGEIVELARSHKLDIAIDLKGYTSGTRSELFGFRLAPIQINYLGYPGTMACEAIDYIIADSTLIPKEFRQFYTESVLFLPHCYQPNDNQREIAATSTTRADFGLPEEGFVFCCFNNSYKITLDEFDIWMRILAKLDGSVLWLLGSNIWMEQNLRREAEARGVSPDRLIFGDKLSYPQHLARHKHADLFLDTFNYNAHTTASDALWTGLPVVTRPGSQFAARVAASLLNAVGLSELITGSKEDYERKILDLATRPKELLRIRDRLQRNRLKQPLFDTTRYAGNFEAGLQLAYDRYFAGEKPSDITVPDQPAKSSR